MTATETTTETTEMKMQVTAKTDGRRISELCSTRCAKNSLLPYIQGQVERRKGSRDNCILVVCVRYPV